LLLRQTISQREFASCRERWILHVELKIADAFRQSKIRAGADLIPDVVFRERTPPHVGLGFGRDCVLQLAGSEIGITDADFLRLLLPRIGRRLLARRRLRRCHLVDAGAHERARCAAIKFRRRWRWI
jgi:hypothetical protein